MDTARKGGAWSERKAVRSATSRRQLVDELSPLRRTKKGRDVSYWHFSDVPIRAINVRNRGKSGQHLLNLSFTAFDPTRTWGGRKSRYGVFGRWTIPLDVRRFDDRPPFLNLGLCSSARASGLCCSRGKISCALPRLSSFPF
jgi:hypothetical protein